jgi:hypothetical protein
MLLPSYYCFLRRLTFNQIPFCHINCPLNLSKIKYHSTLFLNNIKQHNLYNNSSISNININIDTNINNNISLLLKRMDEQWDEGEIPWDVEYLLPSNKINF